MVVSLDEQLKGNRSRLQTLQKHLKSGDWYGSQHPWTNGYCPFYYYPDGFPVDSLR
jgi:uncharacterized membrane protein